jgi:hypothetical protein
MGLSWDFTKLSQIVVFMDLKIKIVDKRFDCSLYAKPMALYLYLPPPLLVIPLVYSRALSIDKSSESTNSAHAARTLTPSLQPSIAAC